jgi:hypothetical protein
MTPLVSWPAPGHHDQDRKRSSIEIGSLSQFSGEEICPFFDAGCRAFAVGLVLVQTAGRAKLLPAESRADQTETSVTLKATARAAFPGRRRPHQGPLWSVRFVAHRRHVCSDTHQLEGGRPERGSTRHAIRRFRPADPTDPGGWGIGRRRVSGDEPLDRCALELAVKQSNCRPAAANLAVNVSRYGYERRRRMPPTPANCRDDPAASMTAAAS